MLPCQVLDTSLLPPRDRFACWYEVIESQAAPARISSPHLDDFVAQARSIDLGSVKLAGLRYPTLDTRRTSKLVRTTQPDNYQFVLTTAGDSAISQDRNHSAVEPASFTFIDNCRPFVGRHLSTGPDLAGSISIVIPHQALSLPADRIRRLLATSIPSDTGMPALLAQFVRRLMRYPEQYQASAAVMLGAMAVDLVAGTLAQLLDRPEILPNEVHQRTLRMQIRSFIEKHLGDPELTPRTIAAAHHVSLRSLHRLFEGEDVTVAELIRRQRLERCRRDLATPLMARQPIYAIAARWGFPDRAHFSRLFRATYGMSAQEYREHGR
ncbi:helix-turn-helix domain-containing protein [Micromonospora sp. C31]|uniref:AraC-like ligand-binding domain-containing protein n=1 Tax=Micromonospora sp. C31 TaxID=2824876 RepID=UPI001B37A1A0|nr:helix-turn-helix domain-containing protein [Micromonospora sp. C31]MBQ1074932.1 helix-turn-helix domain-containing protein [Micromonospora sp. C31]